LTKQAICQATKKDGTRCTCAPIHGTKFCYWHSPRQKGPKKTPEEIIPKESSFDLTTIEGINGLLSLVVKGLLAKKIDAKTANCIGYNLNILSRNLVNIELERRVVALEEKMAEGT
jgi:hypothetical protein